MLLIESLLERNEFGDIFELFKLIHCKNTQESSADEVSAFAFSSSNYKYSYKVDIDNRKGTIHTCSEIGCFPCNFLRCFQRVPKYLFRNKDYIFENKLLIFVKRRDQGETKTSPPCYSGAC